MASRPMTLSPAVLRALSAERSDPSKPLFCRLLDASASFAANSTGLRRICDDLSRSRLQSRPEASETTATTSPGS